MSNMEQLTKQAEEVSNQMADCITVCNLALEEDSFNPDLFALAYHQLSEHKETLKSLIERASQAALKGQTIH